MGLPFRQFYFLVSDKVEKLELDTPGGYGCLLWSGGQYQLTPTLRFIPIHLLVRITF
jgi:hypothetical protein